MSSQATFLDNSRKIMNKPLEGMQPLYKATGSDEQFNYLDGTHGGPKNWGSLSPDWKTCADGKFQSPINIKVKQTQVIRADLKRAYKDAPAKLINGYNNIGIEWLGDAGGIETNGSTYKLYQCHWHMPSEHAIDGKKFDAELHLVHKNDKGQKAVIAILQAAGKPDPFITSLTEKIKLIGENEGIDLGNIVARTRDGHLHETSKSDMPHTTSVDNSRKNRPPLKGVQPITKGEEFNYLEGTPNGPKNWGNVSPDWKTCADGKSQSPINIEIKRAQVKASDLKYAYMGAPAILVNGHNNIGVEWVGDAGGIVMNGTTYKLRQCHWHTPSEHAIDGKKFDVELHLVHRSDKNQKAVIGVLQTIGQPDPFIGSLTEKIKKLGTNKEMDLGILNASSIIRLGSKRSYRYVGSFTTPPCNEGVIWTIAEKDRSVSQEQIGLLKGVHLREFKENARPLQQLGGRPLWQFDLP
ncbi:hypothetical protein SSX86_026603 [Deinandra increscens subsp. villosa]|uniref:Carbonic anhydrase n=1 Tax=Deinandra increscens subsp. villosa TaxID=3103831 RepID=A0AAP0CEU5_9ASTR